MDHSRLVAMSVPMANREEQGKDGGGNMGNNGDDDTELSMDKS